MDPDELRRQEYERYLQHVGMSNRAMVNQGLGDIAGQRPDLINTAALDNIGNINANWLRPGKVWAATGQTGGMMAAAEKVGSFEIYKVANGFYVNSQSGKAEASAYIAKDIEEVKDLIAVALVTGKLDKEDK